MRPFPPTTGGREAPPRLPPTMCRAGPCVYANRAGASSSHRACVLLGGANCNSHAPACACLVPACPACGCPVMVGSPTYSVGSPHATVATICYFRWALLRLAATTGLARFPVADQWAPGLAAPSPTPACTDHPVGGEPPRWVPAPATRRRTGPAEDATVSCELLQPGCPAVAPRSELPPHPRPAAVCFFFLLFSTPNQAFMRVRANGAGVWVYTAGEVVVAHAKIARR